MTTINEQFEKFAAFQKEAYEPVKAFTGIAAETFEKLARQNYAVFGDYVDFAIEQAYLPTRAKDANEFFGKQAETNRAFGEKLVARFQEYTEIARAAQDKAQEAGEKAVAPEKTKKAA